MNQHVSAEAPLEGKASATLGADEGLLGARSVHGLVGFKLQQIAERLSAESAAQRLLLLSPALTRRSDPGPGLRWAFRSDHVNRVSAVFWINFLHLAEEGNCDHSMITNSIIKRRQTCCFFQVLAHIINYNCRKNLLERPSRVRWVR